MLPGDLFFSAQERIAPHVLTTPALWDPQDRVHVKWENRQRTGSFKLRGAVNRVLALSTAELRQGVVTASAGNHGQGVAYASRLRGAKARVFASGNASSLKVEAMRALGAEVILVAGGYQEAEVAAMEWGREHGAAWVSPYNDALVIAGQGTLGLEILADFQNLEVANVVVPAGGGGLASGIGCIVKMFRPQWKVIAVQSQASPFLYRFYKGLGLHHVQERPSVADGLAGPVEEGSMTLELVKEVVDDFLLLEEEEIEQAVAVAWLRWGERVEGSGAAALAGAWRLGSKERPAIAVVTGGNIDPGLHMRLCTRWGISAMGDSNRLPGECPPQ
ncbi:MAG: pyridoxal-phosphate dependent enzyme [Anaerolineales bacterium]|jgi:threonine dehydratase